MKSKFWVAAAALLMASSAQAAGVFRTFAVSIEAPGPFTWNSSDLSTDVAFDLIGSVSSSPYTFASPLVPGGSVTMPALTLSSPTLGGVFGVVTYGTPPVPEPESLALALAGLGVAGVAWRRRAKA